MKILFGALVLVSVLVGLDWALEYNNVVKFGFFAPRYEAARRDTFEQSRAFNEGMNQELQQMWLDYQRAGPDEKVALRSVILHRTADYDVDRIPNRDLRAFVVNLRNGG